VAGRLAAGFGERREVGDLRWRGAFITAPANRDVHAVAHGRVAFADWLRGFGLLIIIDHGDDYMTLYGHNQSLYKAVGDTVAPGDVIASVGDTGGMDRNGVYFELRHKGEPQNPQNWCAGAPEAAQAKR
jgi:septal ring factor EnvC (AmiA/AmiB activator)